MSFETLLYEKEHRVATLTLIRPDRRNTFNETMAEELAKAWATVKGDPGWHA